jgi:endonuclease IV
MPLFLHAPYVVNVAARDPVVLKRSTASLEFALARGASLDRVEGCDLVVELTSRGR